MIQVINLGILLLFTILRIGHSRKIFGVSYLPWENRLKGLGLSWATTILFFFNLKKQEASRWLLLRITGCTSLFLIIDWLILVLWARILLGATTKKAVVVLKSGLTKLMLPPDGPTCSQRPSSLIFLGPLRINVGSIFSGPKPFRFEQFWLKEPGCKPIFKTAWYARFSGSHALQLTCKTAATKQALQK